MSDGPGVRGSPFFQAICMFVVFALAGVPVYRLTRPAAATAAVASASASAGTDDPAATDGGGPAAKPAPLEVEAVFAPAPADFQLRNLDRTVLAGRGPQARFQTRWTAAVPAEGVDLVLRARWAASALAAAGDAPAAPPTAAPGANPAAARVTVRFADGRQVEKTFWAAANGTLTEVFTVPGGAPATAAAP